jgi:hypothetical protein
MDRALTYSDFHPSLTSPSFLKSFQLMQICFILFYIFIQIMQICIKITILCHLKNWYHQTWWHALLKIQTTSKAYWIYKNYHCNETMLLLKKEVHEGCHCISCLTQLIPSMVLFLRDQVKYFFFHSARVQYFQITIH